MRWRRDMWLKAKSFSGQAILLWKQIFSWVMHSIQMPLIIFNDECNIIHATKLLFPFKGLCPLMWFLFYFIFPIQSSTFNRDSTLAPEVSWVGPHKSYTTKHGSGHVMLVTVAEAHQMFCCARGKTVSRSLLALNIPGKALCNVCHSVMKYGGRGKDALNSDTHLNELKMQKANYELGSCWGKKGKVFSWILCHLSLYL